MQNMLWQTTDRGRDIKILPQYSWNAIIEKSLSFTSDGRQIFCILELDWYSSKFYFLLKKKKTSKYIILKEKLKYFLHSFTWKLTEPWKL